MINQQVFQCRPFFLRRLCGRRPAGPDAGLFLFGHGRLLAGYGHHLLTHQTFIEIVLKSTEDFAI